MMNRAKSVRIDETRKYVYNAYTKNVHNVEQQTDRQCNDSPTKKAKKKKKENKNRR